MTFDAFARSLPYGSAPLGDIVAAGQPTAAQLAEAAHAGIKTVIDLRAQAEPRGFDEASVVAAAGMTYLAIPVTPDTLTDAVFDRFLTAMRDPARGPVLVKCATANRVGALLLPYLMLDERMPGEAALALARGVGLRSPDYAALAADYARRRAATD